MGRIMEVDANGEITIVESDDCTRVVFFNQIDSCDLLNWLNWLFKAMNHQCVVGAFRKSIGKYFSKK